MGVIRKDDLPSNKEQWDRFPIDISMLEKTYFFLLDRICAVIIIPLTIKLMNDRDT